MRPICSKIACFYQIYIYGFFYLFWLLFQHPPIDIASVISLLSNPRIYMQGIKALKPAEFVARYRVLDLRMNIQVHFYVHVYIFVYVYVCACVYTFAFECTYAFVCVRAYVSTCGRKCLLIRAHQHACRILRGFPRESPGARGRSGGTQTRPLCLRAGGPGSASGVKVTAASTQRGRAGVDER